MAEEHGGEAVEDALLDVADLMEFVVGARGQEDTSKVRP